MPAACSLRPPAELVGARDRCAHAPRSGARSVHAGGLGCPCAWPPAGFPWGDIRPAPRPLPMAGNSWTRGSGVGAGKLRRKETPASGEGMGPGDSLCSARVPASGQAGEEEEGWAGASEGIFLSQLESDAGGSVLPRPLPGDGNLLHFPGAGSPTLPHTSPPAPLPASAPLTRLGRTQAAPPPPLRGKAAAPQTPGGRDWGWGPLAAAGALSNT